MEPVQSPQRRIGSLAPGRKAGQFGLQLAGLLLQRQDPADAHHVQAIGGQRPDLLLQPVELRRLTGADAGPLAALYGDRGSCGSLHWGHPRRWRRLVDKVTMLGTGHQVSVRVVERADGAQPALLQHPPRAGVAGHRRRDDPVEVQAPEC